jgi:hypothetical protein
MLAIMEADREEKKVDKENLPEEMKAWREEIHSLRFETKNTRKEPMACQEVESRLEEDEPSSVDMKPEVTQEEVPKEDAEGMPVGEPRSAAAEGRKGPRIRLGTGNYW